jgi:NADH-quinone oxidoreductase subunit M
MVIGGCYSLWLFNRVSYGNLKTQYIREFLDISKKEFFLFIPLIIGTFVMGVYPKIFLDPMHFSVNMLVEYMNF